MEINSNNAQEVFIKLYTCLKHIIILKTLLQNWQTHERVSTTIYVIGFDLILGIQLKREMLFPRQTTPLEMDCMLFTYEYWVPLICTGASLEWHFLLRFMNSFNKNRGCYFPPSKLCFPYVRTDNGRLDAICGTVTVAEVRLTAVGTHGDIPLVSRQRTLLRSVAYL